MLKIGTSYFGNRILRHVAKDMDQLARQNFNLVVHTYNENDLLFYRQQMNNIVRVTKDAGHEAWVDPWGVGKVFGGEAFSNFVCTNLDCLQILSDDKPGGMACPMSPTFRQFMVSWIEAALETGADMIFWDEPHFSISTWIGGRKGQWGCRCATCQQHFRDRFGYEMPRERNADVAAYLEWGIHDFLSFLIGKTKELGGHNALCLLPHSEEEEGAVSIWDRFAAIDGVDVFGTDPYFDLQRKGLEHVDEFTKRVVDACAKHNRESQIWFQGFKVSAGREELQAQAIERVYEMGVRNFAVWGFEACDQISWIRPDNPQKLWQIFVDKFGELKQREAASAQK